VRADVTDNDGYRGLEGTRPYAGAAEYYARYRPRASEDLVRRLGDALGWSRESRVLDLGTGPGHLALRIAPVVGEVLGVDPEPDMLSVAQRLAAETATTNVTFVLGSSDDLPALDLGSFQSVTMSASFHWMLEKDRVMADLASITSADRGGVCFVTTGELVGPSEEFVAAEGVVRRLLDGCLADAPEAPHPRGRHDPFEEILGRSSFSEVHEIELTYEATTEITADALLGFHYSISHVLTRLGSRRKQLEANAAAGLAALHLPPTTRVIYRDSALVGLRPRVGPNG